MRCRTVSARDRFGDYGLIGFQVLDIADPRSWLIRDLMFSCRILGRHVDVFTLAQTVEEARAARVELLVAAFRRSGRNDSAIAALEAAGFERRDEELFAETLPLGASIDCEPTYVGDGDRIPGKSSLFVGRQRSEGDRAAPEREVPEDAGIAVVRGKQAQIGEATEPYVTQGVRNGIWGEPFLNIPKELGPYAYSTFNVRLETIQKDPELVRAFVRGMVKGLKFLYANRDEAADIAKKQFPTMPLEDLKATLSRSFADELWSKDGMITREAWTTASSVVRGADILKVDVGYDEIIDMSFVESIRANLQ